LVALGVFSFAAVTCTPNSARADSGDVATAERLFQEAIRHVEGGDYKDACPKFAESQRLDPALGTKFNLADCYEHVGRTASAWKLFSEVAEAAHAAGKSTREREARHRIELLEPALPRLRIEVQTPTSGLEIVRDDVRVPNAEWGAAVPLDPGTYTIVARAPGRMPWSQQVVMRASSTIRVDIPSLTEDPSHAGAPSNQPTPTAAPQPESDNGRTRKWVGGSIAGAGIVGLGIGTAYGFLSLSRHDRAVSLCDPDRCTSAEGSAMWHDATTAGNVSTVALVSGGIALAAGAIIWLTTPKPRETRTP
jgi:serine/threonine-protein kinase